MKLGKTLNTLVEMVNNYYAFGLLLYALILYAASNTHMFVGIALASTLLMAGWGGFMLKDYMARRSLRHGFRILSSSASYEIGNNRRYKLHYSTKLRAEFDQLMVYSIAYQWTGEGEETIPKITGKNLKLMTYVNQKPRKASPYEAMTVSTDGDWRYWFIAINPPVHYGDTVNINYSQEFIDKKGKARPYFYQFARVPMEQLELNVKFPANITPKNVTCSYIKPNQPARPYKADGVVYDKNKRWATWVVKKPKVGYCYRIHWQEK